MDTSRIARAAVAAALTSFVALVVKDLVIAAAGGVGRTWWENPPFYIALVLALASLALTGLAAWQGRTWTARVGVVVGMLLSCAAAAAVGLVVVDAVQPPDPGWIWGELSLLMLPLSALALALVLPRWPTAQLPGRAGAAAPGSAGTFGV